MLGRFTNPLSSPSLSFASAAEADPRMRAAARAIFVLVNIVVSPVKVLSHPAGVLAYVVGARRRGVNPPDVLIKLISERVVRYGKSLPDHEVLPCSGLWNAVLGSRTKVVFQHRFLDDCIV